MKKVLVAYFSHKGENYFSGKIVDIQIGNTCIAAQKAADMLGCDIFEIEEEEEYPVDYRQCVARAVKEKKEDARPKIKDCCDITPYDVVVLGYPNWCGTMPMPVWTFLQSGDFSGKIILPFCTNEGSGMGQSVADIRKLCASSDVREGLSITGGKVGESDYLIKNWLSDNGLV